MQPIVHIIKIFDKLEVLIGKELIAATHAIIQLNPQIILLDIEKVTFADSGGLGAVVRAFKISQVAGIRFVIFTSQNQVLNLFNLTSINQILEIYKTKEEFYQQLKKEIPEYTYLTEIPEIPFIISLPLNDSSKLK